MTAAQEVSLPDPDGWDGVVRYTIRVDGGEAVIEAGTPEARDRIEMLVQIGSLVLAQ